MEPIEPTAEVPNLNPTQAQPASPGIAWRCPFSSCNYVVDPAKCTAVKQAWRRHLVSCIKQRASSSVQDHPDWSTSDVRLALEAQLHAGFLQAKGYKWCPNDECCLLGARQRHNKCWNPRVNWFVANQDAGNVQLKRPSDNIPNRQDAVRDELVDMQQEAQPTQDAHAFDVTLLDNLPELEIIASMHKHIYDPCRRALGVAVGLLWQEALCYTLEIIHTHNSVNSFKLWFMLGPCTIGTAALERGGAATWAAWEPQAARKLRRWLRGDFASLWEETVREHAAREKREAHMAAAPTQADLELNSAYAADDLPDEEQELAHTSRRVDRLVAMGRTADAAAAVLAEKPTELTPAVIDLLRSKLPIPAVPWQPKDAAPGLAAETDKVVALMSTFKRGTSAGLSGITPELLLAALRYSSANSGALGQALGNVIHLLVNGLAPKAVSSWLVGGRLVPIGAKARPIVVSDVLARLASKVALDAVRHKLPDIFGDLQGGVGEANARERTAHAMAADIQEHRQQEWGVLMIDFKNGFNMASRAHIAQEVTTHLPELSRYFAWSYGQPVELVLHNGQRLQALEGTCQGDPASPMWFALNLQPVLKHIKATFDRLGLVRAFIDDTSCTGPVPTILQVMAYLETPLVTERGLVLQKAKSLVFFPNAGIIDDQQLRRDYEIPDELQVTTSGMITLGCPLGSELFVAKELSKIAAEAVAFNKAVLRVAKPQVALLLARMCSGATKVSHILRCLPPSCTTELCHAVDDSTRNTLLHIMGVDGLSDLQWIQATLPLSQGGLGLTLSVHIKEAAFLAATSVTAPRPAPEQAAGGPINVSHIVTSAISLYNTRVADSDKVDVAAIFARDKPMCQRDLTTRVHKQQFDVLMSDARTSVMDKLRILDQTQAGSSAWMTPVYRSGQLLIPSASYRLLLVRHVGGRYFDAEANPQRCQNSSFSQVLGRQQPCNTPLDAQLHHTTDLCKKSFLRRHNTLAAEFARLCNTMHVDIMREVKCIPGSMSKPADVYMHHGPGGKPVAIDFAVSTPLQASVAHQDLASVRPGFRLRQYEARKQRKYRDEFAAIGDSILFVPFVVSSFGAFGPSASKLVSFLTAKLASAWIMTVQQARSYITVRLCASFMAYQARSLSQTAAAM